MRVPAFLFALLLAAPVAAADWVRVEIVFDTTPHSAEVVSKVIESRLPEEARREEVSFGGTRVTASMVLPKDHDVKALTDRLMALGKFGIHKVVDRASDCQAPPPELLCMPHVDEAEPALLMGPALISNADVASAEISMDQNSGRPAVFVRLTDDGGRRFGFITSASLSELLAIAIDGTVQSAPRVMSPILGGSMVIQGNFSVADAAGLAAMLNGDPLPDEIRLISTKVVRADPPGVVDRLRSLFD